MSLPTKIVINPHVQQTTVEGDIVLMDMKRGVYLGLDPVASSFWRSLAEHGDPQRAIGELQERYTVDDDRATRDLETWLRELEAQQLISVSTPP